MSVLGEAGGFEVEVTKHGNIGLFRKPGWPQGDAKIMDSTQARALAALLVTAADEAERGKPPQEIPAHAVLGPFTVDYTYTPRPFEDFKINGLVIPPGTHTVTTFSATEAVAYDKDGRPIASNMPGVLVIAPSRIGQAELPNGAWHIGDDVSVHGINGLEIPPGMPVHTVVCIDGKARALDVDGKIIASNVPGDPGVEKGGE